MKKVYVEMVCDEDVADELLYYSHERVDIIRYDEDPKTIIVMGGEKYRKMEENRKYDIKMVTRGRCIVCGKDLTEGLFFCNECREKPLK